MSIDLRFFQFCGSRRGVYWFRIFGVGLLLKAPWSRALFSEIYGHHRFLPLGGGWRVRWLSRDTTFYRKEA